MWFKELMGFSEENPEQVRENIFIEDNMMHSKVNGTSYNYGRLDVLSLHHLRRISPDLGKYDSEITVSEIIGDVQSFHIDPIYQGALFQAASQFNLLEMTSPDVTPEMGVGRYEYDHTQGPVCAITCGAGTIYRNYFVPLNGRIGQTEENQIDCLKGIGDELGNEDNRLWEMRNGYAMASKSGLIEIADKIKLYTNEEYDLLKSKLKVGIQWDTDVTVTTNRQKVSQIYCSALPVSYSSVPNDYWEEFAQLILASTYEATLHAALINFEKTGNNTVFLTLVGGGAFGNEDEWILSAISKAFHQFKNTPLDIKIISYAKPNPLLQKIVNS